MFSWYSTEFTEEFKVANWRKIRNNKIQTWDKHVWLWDDMMGIAVMAPVPKRPWTKIDPDFSHWMGGVEGELPPKFPPTDFKNWAPEQQMEMVANSALGHLSTSLPIFLMPDEEDDPYEEDDDWDDD